MSAFLDWFFAFITKMFGDLWKGIVGLFKGLIGIFRFDTYFGLFASEQSGFGFFGWIFAIIAFILVYAFWAGVVVLIVIAVKKAIRVRRTKVQQEDLLEEISNLHRDLDKVITEKERIIEMKVAPTLEYQQFLAENSANGEGGVSAEGDEKQGDDSKRFYRLAMVDEKYTYYQAPEYDNDISLRDLCDTLRNYACSQNRLFYEIKTIRLMIAGLSSTKMVLLQGISGTGKTSLPYVMGKFFYNDATIASVQPSWRDRSELFGFFNEFTKKFNETEVLRRIYESSYNDDINIIVLDEMNIARVEYYFAEMLSILEMPDPEEWKIQLVSAVWDTDPAHLTDGKLQIPQNIFYVGTANNDDSTFSVSDKVYDRAFVINLDSKGKPFDAPYTEAKRIAYSHLADLYEKAVKDNPVNDEMLAKVEKLDNYVIEHFRVAFGNRIIKQFKIFVPVYVACGGAELEAVDYMLATKVFRKFESLNLALIRDEIKGLINQLDAIFGKDTMKECIAFLRRLQKSY
ncbi:MAG: hypothetical protein KBS91_01940 [Firmicutes bacterium]|nr:hypothetical protein [Candidatus Caballimonas caccae]